MKLAGKALLSAMTIIMFAGCAVSPEYIQTQTIVDTAKEDQVLMYESQEALTAPLTLEEAMARAVKYNLDGRVKMMEQALAYGDFKMARMDMLPSLAVASGYQNRSNTLASLSRSVLTGEQSLEPSTSQDDERRTADLRFGWNALDFGVSYLQAKQEADRYIVAQMTRKNMMLKMLQQVRSAFWRAASMQAIELEVEELLLSAGISLDELARIREQGFSNPMETLVTQRTLLEIIQKLEQMQQSINASRVELATLINVGPRTTFTLLGTRPVDLPPPPNKLEILEQLALGNSSLYASQLYNLRIDQRESRKNLLRMLPGLDFGYSYNYDSNSFLVNDSWGQAGVSISWNILQLLAAGDMKEQEEARSNLALARRMAINMATVARVHLSWQDYTNSLRRIDRSAALDDINQELSRLTRQASAYDAANDIELIQSEMRALSSYIEKLLNYASAQDAYGGFLLSLGLNPVPESYQVMTMDELSRAIGNALSGWHKGRLPVPAGYGDVGVSPELLQTMAQVQLSKGYPH